MRIAFVIRSLGVGGAERQLVSLARGLAAKGHAVTVFTFYSGSRLEQSLHDAGVGVISLAKKSRWDLLGPISRLYRSLRRSRIDVLHGYMPAESLLSLIVGRLAKVPVVVWGVRASSLQGHDYGITTRAIYALQSFVAARADLVISNSHAGLAGVRNLRPGQAVVIANGIDCERFRPDPALRQRGRSQLRVAADTRLIAIVGRLDPMKGHDVFLRAAAQSRPLTTAPLRFVIAGDGAGPYRQRLAELAAELRISTALDWMPAVNDPELLYNAADLLVSSSLSEGFSNVIAEALACGTAVVATQVGDAHLIVPPSDRLVSAGDAGMLAQAIVAAVNDASDRTMERRGWIERQFSVRELVSQTERVMSDRLQARRATLAEGSITDA